MATTGFPTWVYHDSKEPFIVQTEAELERLLADDPGWRRNRTPEESTPPHAPPQAPDPSTLGESGPPVPSDADVAAEAAAKAQAMEEAAGNVVAGKADDVIAFIAQVPTEGLDYLAVLRRVEAAGKARTTVLAAIDARVALLTPPPV